MDSKNGRKTLITGGAGFIGSNLALELEKLGHTITIVDNLSSGSLNNLVDFKGKFIKADTGSFETDEKFDVIIHLAAITDTTIENNDVKIQNYMGFENMYKLAYNQNAKFIYASSASVYGRGKIPMKEDQILQPLNVYAQSKVEIDKIAKEYFNSMKIIGLRFFNVYGPREKYKGKSASMITQLLKTMQEGHNPRIFEWGEQKRDFIYVKDVIRAIILAMNSNNSSIYNVGTGTMVSFNKIIQILNDILKTNYKPKYFPNPYISKYQDYTLANTQKAQAELNFKAKFSLKEGIQDLIAK